MVAGLSLLDESEETIASSELFLQEESPSEQSTVKKNETILPSVKEETKAPVAPTPAPQKLQKRKKENETRWIDVAELRRQLSAPEISVSSKKEETLKQNAALLELNGAKQVAALDTGTVSDIRENAPALSETRRMHHCRPHPNRL